jgi:hypothetical protein
MAEATPGSFSLAVLVGGRGYTLDRRDVEHVVELLVNTYGPIEHEQDGDPEIEAARSLGRAFWVRLQVGGDDGVVETSDMQVEVLARVLQDFLVKGSPGLEQLAQAARRFRGDPEFRSLQ